MSTISWYIAEKKTPQQYGYKMEYTTMAEM
jgi:hypothetical protein